MKPLQRLALMTLLGALLAADLHAQDTPWYAVEVIVFRQTELGGADGEAWPLDPPPPASERLEALSSGGGRTPLRLLGGGELALGNIAARLRSAGSYEVLEHFGWIQPGWSQGEGRAVVLPRGWAPPRGAENPYAALPSGARLSGSLRAYRGRFLHLQTDLRWHPDGAPASLSRDTATQSADTEQRARASRVHAMIESRRMRSGEIHYLDHPVLGIIVEMRELPASE